MSYPDPNEARAERQFDKDRRQSKQLYREKQCWAATNWQHDWRHATNAPGWVVGDDCVRCQNCGLKAIASGREKGKQTMSIKLQYRELGDKQQAEAKARFIDADTSRDGYWYELTISGGILCRNRKHPDPSDVIDDGLLDDQPNAK